MSCSHSSSCPLFAQFAMEPALAIWKKHYCDGEYTKCARYKMSLKGQTIPISLLPNGNLVHAAVKTKEELGGTALFNAILKKRVSMVKSMLASQMASSGVVSRDGSTPLMAAANVGSVEIVEVLLKAGCNPFRKNKDGYRALDVARSKKFADCEKAIKAFMLLHPGLKNKVNDDHKMLKIEDEDGLLEATEMKGIVSFLKKISPF